ncbi:MAG: hypothetical protein WBD40_23780 [Tepidisphaeraceae bacterium]
MSQFFPRRTAAVWTGAAALFVVFPASAVNAQLRVATWNISNYTEDSTDRSAALKTAVYGAFSGRSMSPDVFMTQEFTSQGAVNNFLDVLNTAANSPGDWAAAPFVNGADTDSAFFYRTSKVTFAGQTTVIAGVGGSSTQPPRNVQRYDVSLNGYAAPGAAPNLALYSVHMKAADTATDRARRQTEANAIRANAALLPAGTQFLVGGDFNTPDSADPGYARLVESTANNAGRFADPINTPGDWAADSAFRFVHTQDPSGSGGMDDRYDMMLLGTGLKDGKGFEYIGNANVAYSTSTWNDPNHSYRAWGNDGGSFNSTIRTTNNAMVGQSIAEALKTASTSNGGHLPIFLDLRTPAELARGIATINFGDVDLGDLESRAFNIFNGVDASIWGAGGVETLAYTMSAGGAFAVPGGTFTDVAGGGVNGHLVSLDTSTLGLKTGAINLFVGEESVGSISLQANVVPEPGALALLAVATFAVTGRRRDRLS